MDQCRVSAAWSYTKEYRATIISTGLIYWGLALILSQLNYPVTNNILRFINWIIRTGFRDQVLLREIGRIPWQFRAIPMAAGLILVVLGIFVGLWVNTKRQKT